ncbi:MAG TPA: class I SAM-dependent methyltransferase [Acidimicrobiales bacterium]
MRTDIDVPVPQDFTGWGTSFGRVAPRYEAMAFARGGTGLVGDAELDAMHAGLSGLQLGRVLDIGAGTGRVTRSLQSRGWKVTSLDASPEMLDELARTTPGAECVNGMLGQPLPFEDESFDAVVALRVLKYVPNPASAMREIRRVLRPGGRAVIEWTNHRSLARFGYRGAPIQFFTEEELIRLARDAGLRWLSSSAGTRLPHALWAAAPRPFATSVLVRAERCVARLIAPRGGVRGARSVVTTFTAEET